MASENEKGFGLLVPLLVIVLAIGGAVWWKLNERWQREAAVIAERAAVAAQMREQQRLLVRWDDARKVANSAPRVALSGPVTQLQEVKRAVERQAASGCLARPTRELLSAMGMVIDGFVVFMANQADSRLRSTEKFDAAEVVFGRYHALLAACAKA